MSKVSPSDIDAGSKLLTSKISEKGLRYDLTVPFARFVAMNRNDLAFPFRRYQIQTVWRADRPQRGRYREFYQCDADIIGSDSLVNEAELIALFQSIFSSLQLRVNLYLNSRKILAGILDTLGESARFSFFAVALDKLDKVGWDIVAKELVENGFSTAKVDAIKDLVLFEGSNEAKINKLAAFFGSNKIGLQGLAEIKEVLSLSETNGFSSDNLVFDYRLARGLSYYTGLIYEGKAVDVPFGSIVGGGRYDDLTSSFGLPNMSGVGISFGIERILDVMEELNLFPEIATSASAILFTYFDADGRKASLGMANELRKVGIPTEVYPDIAKIKKSFEFADKKKIAYVAVIGESELKEGKANVKNMKNGEQNLLSITEMISLLKQ